MLSFLPSCVHELLQLSFHQIIHFFQSLLGASSLNDFQLGTTGNEQILKQEKKL